MPVARRQLCGTDVTASALGFGCVRLTACRSEGVALETLERAFENGITHFDTARLYGSGHSERVLGRFLKGRRDRVTVTTKLGQLPAAGLGNRRLVISLAKKVLGPFPGLLAKARRRVATGTRQGAFDVDSARQSLETSLATLGTDYVDVLMLHEATLEDAHSGPLQAFLAEQRRAGRVRAVGIGSGFAQLRGDAGLVPAAFPVLQFEHNVLTPNIGALANAEGRAIVAHGVFGPLGRLRAAALERPEAARAFGERVGVDLSDDQAVGSLLLHWNLATNPNGVTLFSSTSPERVAANAVDAGAARFTAGQLAAFGEYARATVVAAAGAAA